MPFAALNAQRERQLQLADADLARARTRQLTLAGVPSARAAVDALALARGPEAPLASALTAALVTEAQAGLAGLQVVLLYAYLPMLGGARRRLLGQFPERDEEIEERLVEAFLGAVSAWPGAEAEPKVCLFLRDRTYQRVRADLRRAVRERESVTLAELEVLDLAGGAAWADRPRTARHAVQFRAGLEQDGAEMSAHLREWAAGRIEARKLALVEATLLRGEGLRDYVEKKFARQSAASRERTYKRLQRERARTVEALREVLAGRRHEFDAAEAA